MKKITALIIALMFVFSFLPAAFACPSICTRLEMKAGAECDMLLCNFVQEVYDVVGYLPDIRLIPSEENKDGIDRLEFQLEHTVISLPFSWEEDGLCVPCPQLTPSEFEFVFLDNALEEVMEYDISVEEYVSTFLEENF